MAATDPEKSRSYYADLYDMLVALEADNIVETSTTIEDTLTAVAAERDAH